MAHRITEPVFTSILDDVSDLRLADRSLYITGVSVEERSRHTASWEATCGDVTFARLVSENASTVVFSVNGEKKKVALRSKKEITEFLESYSFECIYLDITGLPHHVWAPILRGIHSRDELAYCIYVEPGDYQFSASPTESTIFDLSERIQGISPLPGFASFVSQGDRDALFVPLLGFEGTRLAHTLEAVQPRREDIFPVIGVPGFRPEYPFYTYIGNKLKLVESRSWQNVRFAAANCPFALYNLLCELSESNQARRMIIAPIGTKPHALGAILYYFLNARNTEILYDHPGRRKMRTSGTARVCVYDLSLFPCL